MSGIKHLIVAGILIVLSACAIGASKHFPEQTGAVLEEGTDTPIEGAIVVARWEGWISQLVDSQSVCYHVETANTDKTGYYRIPEWSKLPGKVHHERISYNVYKAGYRHVRSEGEMRYLERDAGIVDERLAYLFQLSVILGCGRDGSETKYYALLDLLFVEAKELFSKLDHVPNDTKINYESLRRDLAIVNVDPKFTLSRAAREKKIRAYIEKYLQ